MDSLRIQTMSKYQHCQSGSGHPYAHRLRLKPTTSVIQSMAPQRSLTVTNLHITPRTAFEMERPQTQGTPRVVVINTSIRTAYQTNTNQPFKRVPTFPKLATDPAPNRLTSVTRQTQSSMTTTRRPSGRSNRRESASATHYGTRAQQTQERGNSAQSDRRQERPRTYLTQRQTNTFAAYAKYNQVVQSAKAKERVKAAETAITSNINDLSALMVHNSRKQPELHLSNEKHVWISDWIRSTSSAMKLDELLTDDNKVTKPLAVIHEQ